jgi:hypothetical protein
VLLKAVMHNMRDYQWNKSTKAAVSKAGNQYQSAGLAKTAVYIKTVVWYPELSRGVDWVIQARLGAVWAAKKAIIHKILRGQWRMACATHA